MNSITMKMQADQLIRMALQEDITSEDVSTNAVMPTEVKGTVDLIAKEDGIIAGLDVYARVFQMLDEKTEIDFKCKDGDEVKKGELMATLTGDIRTVIRRTCGTELSAENERNCHLYKTGRKTSGRKQSNTSGYQKNDAKLPCI